MSTRPLRNRAAMRSTANAEPKKPGTSEPREPGARLVARRLAALRLAELPWFRGDLDLSPPDGGAEVCGPPAYSPRPEQK